MKIKTLSVFFFCLITQIVLAEVQKDTIYVYGPGGPFGPVNECAIEFGQKKGIPIKVIAGPDKNWIEQAKKMQLLFTVERSICSPISWKIIQGL